MSSDEYSSGTMAQKNASEIAEYAAKVDDMLDDPAARALVERMPWISDKLSAMRAYIGDIKHFLDYETSGGKVGKAPSARVAVRGGRCPTCGGKHK